MYEFKLLITLNRMRYDLDFNYLWDLILIFPIYSYIDHKVNEKEPVDDSLIEIEYQLYDKLIVCLMKVIF